jgi:hypothetical protein
VISWVVALKQRAAGDGASLGFVAFAVSELHVVPRMPVPRIGWHVQRNNVVDARSARRLAVIDIADRLATQLAQPRIAFRHLWQSDRILPRQASLLCPGRVLSISLLPSFPPLRFRVFPASNGAKPTELQATVGINNENAFTTPAFLPALVATRFIFSLLPCSQTPCSPCVPDDVIEILKEVFLRLRNPSAVGPALL